MLVTPLHQRVSARPLVPVSEESPEAAALANRGATRARKRAMPQQRAGPNLGALYLGEGLRGAGRTNEPENGIDHRALKSGVGDDGNATLELRDERALLFFV